MARCLPRLKATLGNVIVSPGMTNMLSTEPSSAPLPSNVISAIQIAEAVTEPSGLMVSPGW